MSEQQFQKEVMDELKMQEGWHKVDEIRPPDGSFVMTYGYGVAGTEFCQAYYKNKAWQELDSCGDYFDYPPTHWTHLPAKPREAK